MAIDHAWEQFYTEIRLALVSDASPQDRLSKLRSGLCHLQRDSFPSDHVWDEFRKLVNETTKRDTRLGQEERIRAATSQMTDEKAKEHLQAALDIFVDVTKAFGRAEFII
jgi:hypothetical protein